MDIQKIETTRRKFIQKTSGVAAVSAVAAPAILTSVAKGDFTPNCDTLKVGLIGCGGRGTGAASQALSADKNVVLHAMGDIFDDRLQRSMESIRSQQPDRVMVPKERQFLGLDAYENVLNSGVDMVILTTPPGFRPGHLEAAIQMGKHVFCEKPMAVDAPGLRKVIATAKLAKEKGLSLMSGFCWRYHFPKRETFSRVLDGAVGQVMSIYNTYNTGPLWSHSRQEGWTDLEYQLRNWYYFTWLSGDHIAEQAVHSLDMMAWAMGDVTPVKAVASGGRQVRTGEEFGHIFDHFSVVYEYENGAKGFHASRQQGGCSNSYAVEIFGDKGHCMVDCSRNRHEITGKDSDSNWRYRGDSNNMYQTEHDELFAAIRKNEPINDGIWMSNSTMLALMGRMAAYTGKEITWDEAMNSQQVWGPEKLDWNMKLDVPAVAMPGQTKFI
jgi:predicted dehydrogenase